MAFPDDLYLLNPNEDKLYNINTLTGEQTYLGLTEDEPRAVCASQDKISVYVCNKNSNTLSIFRSGKRVKDVYTGNQPWAVCEDIDNSIWVCNYLSNTVSKISYDGEIIKNIMVSPGPRGVTCDSNGTIWVSCFLSNTVDKIVNNTKVDTIAVANNPEGITCDKDNGIWVACYGSNVISYIFKSQKIMDIEVGSSPISLCVTSTGTVYVANYNSHNVTRIKKVITDENLKAYKIDKMNIDVGELPNSCNINSLDNVYITNSGANTISVIAEDKVINTLQTVFSPTAYGDATGSQFKNVIQYKESGGTTGTGKPINGWSFLDMDTNIQNLLTKISSKAVETTANLVSYLNNAQTTVQSALDDLYTRVKAIPDWTKTINDLKSKDTDLDNKISSINNTIGDDGQGILKDIADIKAKNAQQDTDINNIKISNDNTALSGRIDDLDTRVTTNTTDITNLKTAVSGMDIDSLKQSVSKLPELITTVGDNDSGLVKDVNDLKLEVADKSVYNPKDFGALGDGKTDDSGAFKKLIAAMEEKPKQIFIPTGHYIIQSDLEFTTHVNIDFQSYSYLEAVRPEGQTDRIRLIFDRTCGGTLNAFSFDITHNDDVSGSMYFKDCNITYFGAHGVTISNGSYIRTTITTDMNANTTSKVLMFNNVTFYTNTNNIITSCSHVHLNNCRVFCTSTNPTDCIMIKMTLPQNNGSPADVTINPYFNNVIMYASETGMNTACKLVSVPDNSDAFLSNIFTNITNGDDSAGLISGRSDSVAKNHMNNIIYGLDYSKDPFFKNLRSL